MVVREKSKIYHLLNKIIKVFRMLKLKTPFILINYKAFYESTGERAVVLTEKVEHLSDEIGVSIGVAPQPIDLKNVVEATNLPVFAQHIDPISYGGHTGHILPELVKEVGAVGTLIGHSERPLTNPAVKETVKQARKVGLISLVCCDTASSANIRAQFNPDIIAVEPPELVGTGIAVSKANPEVISSSIEAVKRVNRGITVLCGAGISSEEDVAAALKLGTEGVLIASLLKRENFLDILYGMMEIIKSHTRK